MVKRRVQRNAKGRFVKKTSSRVLRKSGETMPKRGYRVSRRRYTRSSRRGTRGGSTGGILPTLVGAAAGWFVPSKVADVQTRAMVYRVATGVAVADAVPVIGRYVPKTVGNVAKGYLLGGLVRELLTEYMPSVSPRSERSAGVEMMVV